MERVRLRFNETKKRHKQEITLGLVPVRLWAYPSGLTDRWYVTIHDLADVLIVGPLLCVPGINLLRPYKHLAIPQGSLFVYAEDGEPPTFSTLDVSRRVLYA